MRPTRRPRRRRPTRVQHLVAAGGMALHVACSDPSPESGSRDQTTTGGASTTTGGDYTVIAYPITPVPAVSSVMGPIPDPNDAPVLPQTDCWPLCNDVQVHDPAQAHACAYPAPGSKVGSPDTNADASACCPPAASTRPTAEGCGPGAVQCPSLCDPAAAADPAVPKRCTHPVAGSGVATGEVAGACCPPSAAANPNLRCP